MVYSFMILQVLQAQPGKLMSAPCDVCRGGSAGATGASSRVASLTWGTSHVGESHSLEGLWLLPFARWEATGRFRAHI